MPIYEYVCSDCGHEFELFVRSTLAVAQSTCPHCDSPRIEKRFSTFATKGSTMASGSIGASPAPSCTSPV